MVSVFWPGCWDQYWALPMKLPLGEFNWILLLLCQNGFKWIFGVNRPVLQIPQCTCPIFHNTSSKTKMSTFLFLTVYCGIGTGALWDLWYVSIVRHLYLIPCNKHLILNPLQIAKFVGPTWSPPGSCRPQMGPMLAPWTLLSGILLVLYWWVW